ncbi:zinc transporter ZIP13-like [Stegodyphus dumicola]|uniref:zinc transporter ZIP13-like n=1 Tax=Stegodyphus dumicola TaxID=202533 RepID=UPI0015AB11EE|nr:zinc transporter ZIP13-like [Stegodyphus dumicola]
MYKLCLCSLSLYYLHLATAATEVTDCSTNCESSVYWFQDLFFNGLSDNNRYQTWILSILASCVIGLTGIVPLIIFVPSRELNYQGGSKLLRLLLSFAVGGLLGDVFLHLLPEAWKHIESLGPELHSSHLTLGLWVLIGMFSFVIIEIMFAASQNSKEISDNAIEISENNFYSEKKHEKQILTSSSNILCNGNSSCHKVASEMQQTFMQNGYLKTSNGSLIKEVPKVLQTIHISGYLNLMANSIDNFTHGLAVAASFLVGIKVIFFMNIVLNPFLNNEM